jgi:hypothetical protein
MKFGKRKKKKKWTKEAIKFGGRKKYYDGLYPSTRL